MGYIKYKHEYSDGNSANVWVREDLKGRHREHCLCWSCDRFKPNTPFNCVKAQIVFNVCHANLLVLPVWECPHFEEKKTVHYSMENSSPVHGG